MLQPKVECLIASEQTPQPVSGAQKKDVQALVNEAYSAPTWWYDFRGFFIVGLAHQTTLWAQMKFLEKNVSSNHLEVPVGSGTLLKFVLWLRKFRNRPASQVIGVDYSSVMVMGAKRTFKKWSNICIQQGDVTRLDFPDHAFQSINLTNGLHCFPDPHSAMSELRRVLAPNGSLAATILIHPRGFGPFRWIASSINSNAMKNGLLVRPFDIEEVRKLFALHGFTIQEETISGNTINIVSTRESVKQE